MNHIPPTDGDLTNATMSQTSNPTKTDVHRLIQDGDGRNESVDAYRELVARLYTLSERKAALETDLDRTEDPEYRELRDEIAQIRTRLDELVDGFDDNHFFSAFHLLPEGQLT